MTNILVIGATSEIAKCCIREWAKHGNTMFLVARNKNKLDCFTTSLPQKHKERCFKSIISFEDEQQRQQVILRSVEALKNIDLVFVCFGCFPQEVCDQISHSEAIKTYDVNVLQQISFLNLVKKVLLKQGKGTIALVSSVAGDRGRADNYLYGSTKAAISVFLSGLRQELYSYGIQVVTIKPGRVRTPMTKGMRGLFFASPQRVAFEIVNSLKKGASVVYVPRYWILISFLIRVVPETLFKRLGAPKK